MALCIKKMFIILVCTGFMILIYYCHAQSGNKNPTNIMQRTSLLGNKKKPEKEPLFGTIKASDGIELSYASYVPEVPQTVLIFYHGSAAHGCAGYTYMAEQLSQTYSIATYLVDMRGHGKSGGQRGDTPYIHQVWEDVRTAMKHIQTIHPNSPIMLGAHSGGAGMLLNYAYWQGHLEPAGYFFVTPMLGRQLDILRDRERNNGKPFAQMHQCALWLHYITGGYVAGNWPAVTFNYPDHLIHEQHFVRTYTVNMVYAINPSNSIETLLHISVPVYICIADQDELFDPDKMDRMLVPIAYKNPMITIAHFEQSFHLTILGEVHGYIGKAIQHILDKN